MLSNKTLGIEIGGSTFLNSIINKFNELKYQYFIDLNVEVLFFIKKKS